MNIEELPLFEAQALGKLHCFYKGSFQQVLRELYFRQDNISPPERKRFRTSADNMMSCPGKGQRQ